MDITSNCLPVTAIFTTMSLFFTDLLGTFKDAIALVTSIVQKHRLVTCTVVHIIRGTYQPSP